MDPDWTRQLNAGSAGAFARIMDATKGLVFGVAVRITGRAAEAEDVLQEAFLRLWTHRAQVEEVTGWLRRVATNLAIDMRKKRKREEALEPRLPAAPRPEIEEATMQKALDALDAERREVYHLRVNGGLSYREIASRLGISQGTVMSRLFRARQDLYDRLKELLKDDL